MTTEDCINRLTKQQSPFFLHATTHSPPLLPKWIAYPHSVHRSGQAKVSREGDAPSSWQIQILKQNNLWSYRGQAIRCPLDSVDHLCNRAWSFNKNQAQTMLKLNRTNKSQSIAVATHTKNKQSPKEDELTKIYRILPRHCSKHSLAKAWLQVFVIQQSFHRRHHLRLVLRLARTAHHARASL